MSNSVPAPQNMALYELLHQLMALSDDTQAAGRLLILDSAGAFVGELTLSDTDVAAASQALGAYLDARHAMRQSTQTVPLPDSAEAVAEGIAELEAWLANDKRTPRPRDGE